MRAKPKKHKSQPMAGILYLTLGMGCYWCWFISGLFSTSVWYRSEQSSWMLVMLSNLITLVLLFALSKNKGLFICNLPFAIGAGIVTSTGIVLATIGLNVKELSPMSIPGALLTGIGSAPLVLLWREAFELTIPKYTGHTLVATSMLFAVFFYLFFITLPFAAALIICSAAPVISVLLFRLAYLSQPHESKLQHKSINVDSANQVLDEAMKTNTEDKASFPNMKRKAGTVKNLSQI